MTEQEIADAKELLELTEKVKEFLAKIQLDTSDLIDQIEEVA